MYLRSNGRYRIVRTYRSRSLMPRISFLHRSTSNSASGDPDVEREIGYSVKAKWDVERCKKEIRGISDLERYVRTILYRPFDRRYIFYLPSLLDTPSRPVSETVFDHENIVLLTPGVKTSSDFTHALVSREPAEKK